MHARTETRSPRTKPAVSHFPNILHSSTYSTLLGDRQKITKTPSQIDRDGEHQHAHQVDHHQIAAFLVSILSHIFAPAAYQQCTSSTPCWVASHSHECSSRSCEKTATVVDDDFVLLEERDSEEQDGGPICREATIESWKAPKKARRMYGDARRWSDLPYFGCP
ncbi:hypothetical protein C7974DRAFT_114619 [Boeremia exigua]|uniref:uncharacterized protein n=1 Tax=Boeremia exigua TaxID=749465 RepID=UPI001E8D1AF4|nr:uncharacterized protein C7974DRAFT_114619 [Boeremia exigua]KAH6643011.1 hypothetical protein C7974DRAFT_114619 [Boeremia exigua]